MRGDAARREQEAAIIESVITAHYQPIVSLATGDILGYEALARRVRADGTTELPGAWLTEMLSDAGQSRRLGATMLGAAATALRSLPEHIYVSVNLEVADLRAGNFVEAREEHGLDELAHRLVIEVAERESITQHAIEAAALARSLGARIALDDIGAGSARLSALVDLQPSYLKVDASITRRLTEPGIARLVRFLVSGAETLGASIIVEGVEDEAIAAAARDAGASAGQGYYFGKPGPLP